MFLHLGKNLIVHVKDIIAIIDIKTVRTSEDTGRFMEIADEEGFIKNVSGDEPKSMVICEKTMGRNSNNKTGVSVVYLSSISSTTLNKRAGFAHNAFDK